MRICWVGVKAVTVVLLLLSASPAFGFMHHVFEGWPSRLHVPARPESRYFCRPGRRGSQLALSGEELAVGAGETAGGVWGDESRESGGRLD